MALYERRESVLALMCGLDANIGQPRRARCDAESVLRCAAYHVEYGRGLLDAASKDAADMLYALIPLVRKDRTPIRWRGIPCAK